MTKSSTSWFPKGFTPLPPDVPRFNAPEENRASSAGKKSRLSGRAAAGFTLIELTITIGIVGVLMAAVFASMSTARLRSRDARKQADFKTFQNALNLYYSTNAAMPANPQSGKLLCEGGDTAVGYTTFMTGLVHTGYLQKIPRSPGGGGYCYYDYGPGSAAGAVIGTSLESAPASVIGIPPSCRPFIAGSNWCDRDVSREYCICTTY